MLNIIVTMLSLVHMLYWRNLTALSIMKPISTPQIFGYLSVRIAFAAQEHIRTMLLACVKNIVYGKMVVAVVSSYRLEYKYI